MSAVGSLRLVLVALAGASVVTHLSADDLEEGKRLYQVHCQACHGDDGTGKGPMRDQLEVDPPDLTTIAIRHDGVFPRDEIQQLIDGRIESPSHGSRQMPVWGFTFQTIAGDSGQEKDVEAMIGALTRFLESIQVRP